MARPKSMFNKKRVSFRLLPELLERIEAFRVARDLADTTKALETMIEESSMAESERGRVRKSQSTLSGK